jgi:hypothetical protein
MKVIFFLGVEWIAENHLSRMKMSEPSDVTTLAFPHLHCKAVSTGTWMLLTFPNVSKVAKVVVQLS